MSTTPIPGTIGWTDLTVPDAVALRDFYRSVVGWRAAPVDMGGYADFGMIPRGAEQPACGICHARGTNADLPAQWMIYIHVANLDRALDRCRKGGGTVLAGPKPLAGSQYAVIRDPAGAVCALFEAPKTRARKRQSGRKRQT
jgi:uncharacterized protein